MELIFFRKFNIRDAMRKTLTNLFFAVSLIASAAFLGDIGSGNNPFSVQAQTYSVETKRPEKKRRVGAIRTVYRGGKYVGKQVWNGTRWVGVKSWHGTRYVGKKTWKGTKWTGRKIKRVVY
jgi:hypothetical protein